MGDRETLSTARSQLRSHPAPHENSSYRECPDQQRDQLVPREKPVITSSVDNESNASQRRVLAQKRKVPNRVEDIAVNCGLRDVEQTHRNKR